MVRMVDANFYSISSCLCQIHVLRTRPHTHTILHFVALLVYHRQYSFPALPQRLKCSGPLRLDLLAFKPFVSRKTFQ
jgi:hypothetical protein